MSFRVTSDHPIREALSVFGLVTLAAVVLGLLAQVPPLGDYVHLAVAALFLLTALHLSGRLPGGAAHYGLSLGGVLEPPEHAPGGVLGSLRDLIAALARAAPLAATEGAWALLVVVIVFPPFVLGFYAFHDPQRAFELSFPPELGSYLLTQTLVVALPEEAFFRGYLQTRLGDAFAGRTRVLGARLSLPALLWTSVGFALIHFAVDQNPARLAVFFPSLLFGWLRELRSGIGAAVFVHALSNLLADVLARGWL